MGCCAKTLRILPLIILLALSAEGLADLTASKIDDTLVDARALTIEGGFGQAINGLAFQQDAVVTHKEYQYAAYYDARRQVCVARRKLPTGTWNVLRFNDYEFKSNDAHNTISIGICPTDGTIHMAFDHHGDVLRYRVSRKHAATNPEGMTWDPSLFGSIKSELEAGESISITYPRFWQTPQGTLQFSYRRGVSGNGDRMLVDYAPETGTWLNTRMIDSGKGIFKDDQGESRSRCSYPNGYDYGPYGKLHVTWVWRESNQEANHDLMYAYSEDQGNTWFSNAGTRLAEPPSINSAGITVANIGRAFGLMNTQGQAVDSQGRVHVVMWHCSIKSLKAAGSKPGEQRWCPAKARRYHHYWRDERGEWAHTELPGVAGNRPKVFLDKADNVYLIFRDRASFLGFGDLVIAAATAASTWADWKVIYKETGPFANEMLVDRYRWKRDGILSVMVQGAPKKAHEATPLRILDFTFNQE